MSYKFSIFYDDECVINIKDNLIIDALNNLNNEFNTSYKDIKDFMIDKFGTNSEKSIWIDKFGTGEYEYDDRDYFKIYFGIDFRNNKDFLINLIGTMKKDFESISFFKMLEIISPYCRNYKFSYISYAEDERVFYYASSIDGKFLIEKIKIESF